MAGYEDTKQKIISTLMGRPNGTEIQPENHQDYALNMLDYIRSLELIATSTLIGVAESNTTPVQPNSSRVCYIAGVAQNQTVVFENFIGENGTPISVTTGDMEGVFIILLWNTQYWSAQTFNTNIISSSESATFYYRYNIRKTYASIALMNADVANPIGTDGKYIKVGDIVTVVNSTTPSENGIYSYEGATDGWKYQSSFNFQLEQIRSQNTNTAPSSKLFDDELNKNECYNVTNRIPLSAGQYYDLASAIAAVPVANRKLGLKLTYMSALYEKDTLTITTAPTTSGNIVITLNGVAVTIALDSTTDTTPTLVATKIKSTTFTGWTVSGTGATVIFTKNSIGVCSAPIFNAGTTASAANFVRTVVGTTESIVETQFNGNSIISWTTQANWIRTANETDVSNLQADLNNKVYAKTATGANIANLYGIKDITIENAVNGLYYSIASVVKDANNTAINIYSSTDDLGTGATLKAIFTFANETGYAKKIIGASTEELFTLIVNTKEIPNNCSYTSMWPNKYKLNDACYVIGNGSNSITSQSIIEKMDLSYPFLSRSQRAIEIGAAIKEMYLFGVAEQDVKLTLVRKNITSTNETNISIYNADITTKLGGYDSNVPVYGLRIVPLKTGNTVVGYMLIDWDKITDNYNSSGIIFINSYAILTHKIFNQSNNPNISNYITNNNIDINEKKLHFDNMFEDAEFEDTYRMVTSPLSNPLFSNTQFYSEIVSDIDLGCNVIRTTRIIAGYYAGVAFDLSYLKDKIKVGDWIVWGAWVKIKKATTGDAISNALIAINGLATSGYVAYMKKSITGWQWVYNKIQVTKIDSVISMEAYLNQSNITDYSKENGLTLYISKMYFNVYRSSSDIPSVIYYVKPYKDSIRNYINTQLVKLFSKYFGIGNYNNEFYFDDAQIDHLTSRFIGLIPNYNIPHTKNFGFISTDPMSTSILTDSSSDFNWMKAKSPSFIFDNKRKGCMVLFDENGLAYIINQNGEKKFITLT